MRPGRKDRPSRRNDRTHLLPYPNPKPQTLRTSTERTHVFPSLLSTVDVTGSRPSSTEPSTRNCVRRLRRTTSVSNRSVGSFPTYFSLQTQRDAHPTSNKSVHPQINRKGRGYVGNRETPVPDRRLGGVWDSVLVGKGTPGILGDIEV